MGSLFLYTNFFTKIYFLFSQLFMKERKKLIIREKINVLQLLNKQVKIQKKCIK